MRHKRGTRWHSLLLQASHLMPLWFSMSSEGHSCSYFHVSMCLIIPRRYSSRNSMMSIQDLCFKVTESIAKTEQSFAACIYCLVLFYLFGRPHPAMLRGDAWQDLWDHIWCWEFEPGHPGSVPPSFTVTLALYPTFKISCGQSQRKASALFDFAQPWTS